MSAKSWLGLGVLGVVAMTATAGCAVESHEDGTASNADAFSSAGTTVESFEGQWSADFAFSTGPDSPADISYVIEIHGSSVLFSADGYQTDMRMNGKGAVSGSDYVVTFDSCGAEDQFQCSQQTAGEKLFHLHRVGATTTLVWDNLDAEGKNLPLNLTDTYPWTGTWQAVIPIPDQEASITYVVTVDGDKVTFNGDGYQTAVRVNGKAASRGGDLYVTFDSCGKDDQFQCNGESVGDTLFHLHRVGQTSTIIWDTFSGSGTNLALALQQ